jgi:DNA-binding transcriptional regulator PaaX
MGSTDAAWNDLNYAVLAVFTNDLLRTIGDLQRAQPGVPASYIRAAVHQLADLGHLTTHRGAVHTTYRITEAGRRHLTNTMKVA